MDEKYTCKECNEYFTKTKNNLGWHIKNYHAGISYVDYVVKHEYNGIYPVCANQNCQKKLVYCRGGFRKFCSQNCASTGVNNPMYGKKGNLSPNKGKQRTDEQKENYRNSANKRWNPDEYEKYTIEQKEPEKIKENNQLKNRKSNKILQISLDDGSVINTWNFASEPGKELNYNSDRILKVAKGTAKKSNGYFWCYEDKSLQDKYKVYPEDYVNKKSSRKVLS